MVRYGIDLGGTKMEIVALADDSEKVLLRQRLPTEQHKGYDHIVKSLAKLYDQAVLAVGSRSTLGVAIPGSISPKTSKIRNANTQHLNGRELKKDLEALVGQEIWVANDANCLALSEYKFGAGKGYNSLIALILGTGMGGGVVMNNQILLGATGVAAEVGHMTLDAYGKDCWCGNRGCMEKYLSGTGLENLDLEYGQGHRTSVEIYQAYQRGEERANLCLTQYIELFGQAMANLTAIFDPDCIILGGGLSNMDILYTAGLANMKKKLLVPEYCPELLKNQLGDSSGVFGAAILPFEGNYIAR